MSEMQLTGIFIVSRDGESQKESQKLFAQSNSNKSVFFCVHQEMYQSGIVSKVWQDAKHEQFDLFPKATGNVVESDAWTKPPTQAAV